MTAPWKEDDIWMDQSVCDFCMSEVDSGTTELVLSGDQPPVYICLSCVINATLEYNNEVDVQRGQTNSDEVDQAQHVIESIYLRGLELKVHGENSGSELDIGNIPE